MSYYRYDILLGTKIRIHICTDRYRH